MADSELEKMGLPPIESVDTIDDPVFIKNRAMYDRAQRIFTDSTQPQVVRDDAKRQMIFYSMENLRAFDPNYANISKLGKVGVNGDHLLEPSGQADELLLEAGDKKVLIDA